MSILLGPYLALDTETTGTDPEAARVVEICAVDLTPGQPAQPHTMLVDPGVEIPAEAAAIHGITTERAQAEGKPAPEVIDLYVGNIALAARRGIPLVAQNAAYDLTVLDRECRRHGLPTFEERLGGARFVVLDPMVLDRHCIRFRRKVSDTQGARTLKTLAAVYGFPWDDEQAHGAEYDTIMGARVVWRIGQWSQLTVPQLQAKFIGPFTPPTRMKHEDARKFNALGSMGPLELHDAQTHWYREQTEGLVRWFLQQAEEWRHNAADAATDGERETALLKSDDFANRAASASYEWPIRSFDGREALV